MPDEMERGAVATVAHLAGAIVVGSVVAVDPGGWYPFTPTKWWVVSTLVAATVTLAARRGLRPRLPRWSLIAWVVFLLIASLAALFGRDPLYAWFGTPERNLGVLAWLLFGACAAIGSLIGEEMSLARWLRWAVVATAWCTGYAVVEWSFGPPIETAATTSRLGGPFGSAAYLGAALCLLIPFTVAVAADRNQHRAWRAVATVTAVVSLAVIVATGSRAAWVGLVVSGVVVAVVRRPGLRPVLIAAGAAAIAVAVVAPRLSDVLDRDVAATSRLDEWAMASRVVAAHPLLGLGPEGYRTSLADGVTAGYERTYGRAVLPDRAHSAPIDVAAAVGVPGMLVYVGLVGGVAVAAVRAMRGGPAHVGIAAGVLAYLAQQLFLFPLAELDPVLWIGAGILLASPARAPVPAPDRRVRIGMTVAAGLATVVLFVAGLLGVAADRAAHGSDLAGARRAVELRPDVVRYRLLVAALAREQGTLAGIDEAIASTRSALEISPHDPVAQLAEADALSDRALATGADDDIEAAVRTWGSLAEADPLCAECQLGLGAAAALAGDDVRAEEAWRRAESLARPGDDRAANALDRLREVSPP